MCINNFVDIMFNTWYVMIILSYLIFCALHMMQSFVYEKMLKVNHNYPQGRGFVTENEENPVLVLSNVHNITCGPSFGTIGLSMYTTSLWFYPLRGMCSD